MTRGKFVLITETKVYDSTEFNGDMYPDGHGVDVMNRLKDVNNVEDFKKEVNEFNLANHNYQQEKMVWENDMKWFDKAKDFSKAYYDNWFSDFLYVKNLTGKVIVFILTTGERKAVIPFEVVAFNFGENPKGADKKYIEENFK